MLRVRNWTLLLAGLALAIGLSASRAAAEDAKKETGGVSGTLKGEDDKPVSGALVRLLHPMTKGEKKADKQAKADKPVPVATATTDADGKFEMKDVPVGDYEVQTQVKGSGSAHEKVSVKAGETATVDLKLAHKGAGSAKPTVAK